MQKMKDEPHYPELPRRARSQFRNSYQRNVENIFNPNSTEPPRPRLSGSYIAIKPEQLSVTGPNCFLSRAEVFLRKNLNIVGTGKGSPKWVCQLFFGAPFRKFSIVDSPYSIET